MTDLDGRLMLPDEAGCYRLATPAQCKAWEAEAAAQDQKRQEATLRRAARLQMARTRSNDDASEGDASASHFGFPARGQVHGLVVLVEYQDFPFTIDDPLQQYTAMMMQPGYNYSDGKYTHRGSAHDYFVDNSFGQFDPQFDVFGPLRLKHERAYYGANRGYGDVHPHEMIIEACEQLDSLGVDFTQYDANLDGYIDFVFAFFAGPGENASGISSDAVWPHAWDMTSAGAGNLHVFDGKVLEDYACTCELFNGKLDGVGTFCHEFSHVLGLPDLYDINYQASGPYNYSVLDNGCYRQNGYQPVGYSSYERYELGWIEPTRLPDEPASLVLSDFGTTNQAYIYPVPSDTEHSDPREGEYYLFENRQQVCWDSYLPGHGMLVWHIDYVPSKWMSNKVNTWINHQCIDLVEADGIKKKPSGSPDQKGSETFPGTAGHTEFTDDSTPAFCGWTKPGSSDRSMDHRLAHPLTHIAETEDEVPFITFDLLGGAAKLTATIEDVASAPMGITMRDGEISITTATSRYNLWGQRIE